MTNQQGSQKITPDEDRLADLIEIHDPELDPQLLMAEVRKRIEARRAELGYEERTFPSFGNAIPFPEPPHDLPYQADLYHHLRQANLLYEEVETEAVLAHSPALRIPILGSLWKLIRQQAHSLVLYYVNRNLAHQVTINRHLISVLNQLVIENEEFKQSLAKKQNQAAEETLQDGEA